MASTVFDVLNAHSTAPVSSTGMQSQSNKAWTKDFAPIERLLVHTSLIPGTNSVAADFDALAPESDDDALRFGELAHPPNHRNFRLYSEADGANWFNSEISNVVLPAFFRYPSITQCAEEPSRIGTTPIAQLVDTAYTAQYGDRRAHVVIGEFKRNIIRPRPWEDGEVGRAQADLSRELRGYAAKYQCPQIFCFDHATFLMLQFRAKTPADIVKANCEVDCWVFPRNNIDGTPLRYALYRLLVQGFRRFQGMVRLGTPLHNVSPVSCTFFSGKSQWITDTGHHTSHPFNCTCTVDAATGGRYWVDEHGNDVLHQDGSRVWDTGVFWFTE